MQTRHSILLADPCCRDDSMYTGKTLFAQIMDFLPWKTFHRLVSRYDGDHRIRTLPCAEHFRALALAQLTYRESLRDIEACLSAQSAKLYHMGIGSPTLQSSRDRENAHLSDQPVWSSTDDHLRTIQSPVASRVVFQMDQATSPYQEVLRHVRERRQSANSPGVAQHRLQTMPTSQGHLIQHYSVFR